ncbi:MAG: flagellar biosynthesis protein FlhF [Alkalispirochaetaceae bacterium]
MDFFIEQAATDQEVDALIRRKYGERAKILSRKSIQRGGFMGLFSRRGVEVTGYCSHTPSRVEVRQANDFEEERRKILEQGTKEKASSAAIDQVLAELKEIKDQVGSFSETRTLTATATEQLHPTAGHIEKLLFANDFSPGYTREIIGRLKTELSLEALDDRLMVERRVVDWIGESIRTYEPESPGRPETFVLVGPTGVGKTTTIAKLAALRGAVPERKDDVRILTIDSYRIGAREQLETYGKIMYIPVHSVETKEEMEKQLALNREADVIFVDTIGKSPKDFAKLGEMNELLQKCAGAGNVHLAVSATTKTSDIYDIMRHFEPFGYESVVLTKLDETARVGNIISVLHERGKPLSYITDGQKVPQDISRATPLKLLLYLEGFSVDRRYIEDKFGGAA